MTHRLITLLVACCVFVVFGLSLPAQEIAAQPQLSEQDKAHSLKNQKTDKSLKSYYKHLRKTVVAITATKASNGSYYGTGTVISPYGHILTSTTVVPDESFKNITVFLPGFSAKKADVVYANDKYEIAIIKLQDDIKNMTYASFANSDKVEIGDRAFTAGNAFRAIETNDEAVLSSGTVSSRYKAYSTSYREARSRISLPVYSGQMFEITAASNGGGDGGGVYDDRGQIIGLLSLNYEKMRSLGLCIPINVILNKTKEALKDVEKHDAQKLLATLSQTSSTKSLLKDQPIHRLLKHRAQKIHGSLVGLNVKRDNRRQGGDMSRNPYAMGTARPNNSWYIPEGQMTGLFVSTDGLILTSYFAVSGDVKSIEAVNSKGEKFSCDVLGYDQGRDLALLSSGQTVTEFIDFNKGYRLEPGSAIGYVGIASNGHDLSLTMGKVSALERWFGTSYQTDAKANMGINGSVMIDLDGSPCGIVNHSDGKTQWNINSGVSFATSAKYILKSLVEMKKGKKIKVGERGFIGVRLMPEIKTDGGIAVNPEGGKVAEKVGMKKGDVIFQIDNHKVTEAKDLLAALFSKSVGDIVIVKAKRGEEIKTFKIKLAPAANSRRPQPRPEPKPEPQPQPTGKSKINKMVDEAMKNARKQLEETGLKGEELEKALKKMRKRIRKQIKEQEAAKGDKKTSEKKQDAPKENKQAADINKQVEEAMKQVRERLKASGYDDDTIEKIMQSARKQIERQIKEQNKNNKPLPQELHEAELETINAYFNTETASEPSKAKKKPIANTEQKIKKAMETVKKDLEQQGFHGDILEAMLKKAREQFMNQVDGKVYKIAEGPTQKEIDDKVNAAIKQVESEYAALGFHGATLKKMINQVRAHLEKQIVDKAYAVDARGYLGVSLDTQSVEGVGVSVVPQSGKAAERSGLRRGDRIVKFNDREIHSPNDIVDMLSNKSPGDIITLKVKRGGSTLYYSFALDGPNGQVKPSKKQLANRFKRSDTELMIENALSKAIKQLKALGLKGNDFQKALEKVRQNISKEVSSRMEKQGDAK